MPYEPNTTSADRGVSRRLTGPQESRRDRILGAAVSLAVDGGYEAVGMREVAARAEVALATVYRYFPSKDHLLLGVMAESLDRLQFREPEIHHESSADRIFAVLEQATRSMFHNPQLSSAILRAWVVPTGALSEDEARISAVIRDAVLSAVGDIPSAATPENEMRVKLLTRVWFSELLFWANGRASDESLLDTLRASVTYLFPERIPGPR